MRADPHPRQASDRDRQHLAVYTGQLATLTTDRRDLIDSMATAYADKQYEIADHSPFKDCSPWSRRSEDERDAIRLGMLAAVEAAQRLKRERAG